MNKKKEKFISIVIIVLVSPSPLYKNNNFSKKNNNPITHFVKYIYKMIYNKNINFIFFCFEKIFFQSSLFTIFFQFIAYLYNFFKCAKYRDRHEWVKSLAKYKCTVNNNQQCVLKKNLQKYCITIWTQYAIIPNKTKQKCEKSNERKEF